ncbi:hypothetical protein N0V82_001494 [Gnomoniopsis sp. IMI 355080]|nr:hypothetical protein N0V82_001494 [Gnomoniopsis sp. IMI 355080]
MASLSGTSTLQPPSCSPSTSPSEGVGAGGGAPPLALLDFFFPGFSMISAAIQKYAGIDLTIYIPLLAVLCGLIASWQYFSDYFWRQLETYWMSTVDIRIDDEIYNMLMAWVADQGFSKRARRFVANTNLNSRSWFLWRWDDDEDEDDGTGEDGEPTMTSLIGGNKKKALAYTPTFGSHYFFYKGRLCIFRRDRGRDQAAGFLMTSEKEEISISCFGRSPWVLKELLHDARVQFMKRDEAKTLIYRGTVRTGSTEPTWQRMMARVSRPFSTVILNEKVKQDLIDDVTDYLNPATRRWYANRGIPYRRGYLLYGPPGTGKSSLSLALAGFFKMRIYIVSLSSISSTEENLASLFAELPRRCVVLLEDIDTAGLTHTREEDRSQDTNDADDHAPKQGLRGSDKGNTNNNNNNAFRLSLSGLLNILDGVASQEGRVLIMTTNHLEKLDKALIRPGRVDMTVTFGLADTGMTAAIFRAIFAPLEADNPSKSGTNKVEDAALEAEKLAKRLADEKVQREEAILKVDQLAVQFAERIPSHEFSPAELQGFLMKNKRNAEAAVAGADAWVIEIRKEKAANKLKEAEDKRKKDEEAKKQAEEESKKKEDEDKKTKKGEKSKSKMKKSRKGKNSGNESASESESDISSSSGSDSGSESESEAESKKRKSKPKSKSTKKIDVTNKVDKLEKLGNDGAGKAEPVSASEVKQDGFVDVVKEEYTERPKTRGSDSGYSTP